MNSHSERTCGACGEVLAPGASFCRACGTRYDEPTCHACDAPLVSGAAFCRGCGAPVAEPASPRETKPTVIRSVASAPQAPASPPQAQAAEPRRSWRLGVSIAAVILLLGAGAAAAIVLSGGGGSSSTTVAASPNSGSGSAVVTDQEAEEEGSEEESEFPEESRLEMEEEIKSLLLSYHEDVVNGEFQPAWSLLSSRKRQQDLTEYGYPKWKQAQASLSGYLAPAGLRSRIDSLEDEGVVRVMVTGMGWSAPQSPCSEWSGLTWVKYERGLWTYDPGYSTTDDRRREWQSRSSELLGADC